MKCPVNNLCKKPQKTKKHPPTFQKQASAQHAQSRAGRTGSPPHILGSFVSTLSRNNSKFLTTITATAIAQYRYLPNPLREHPRIIFLLTIHHMRSFFLHYTTAIYLCQHPKAIIPQKQGGASPLPIKHNSTKNFR